MLRGIEVRGSFETLASRAPSVLPGASGSSAEARQSEGGKECDEGLPGADIKNTGDVARPLFEI